MNYLELVQSIAKVNYDDRTNFVCRDRLDAIAAHLEGTRWKKVNESGLFDLYAIDGKLPAHAVVISTHADCVDAITACFAREQGDCWLGTFDNLITNAMAMILMLEDRLSPNVAVAFTGDEERGSNGAAEVAEYLRQRGCTLDAIVLDVTPMGFDEDAYFSIENNFWDDDFGKTVIDAAKSADCKWTFVPSSVDEIPDYVPADHVIPMKAWPDESWRYNDLGVHCLSFCIPTKGDMHHNDGVLIHTASVAVYMDTLAKMANALAEK